jgi:hypothetical protein
MSVSSPNEKNDFAENETLKSISSDISQSSISTRLKIICRYYEVFYAIDVCGKRLHDQYLYRNPNGLSVVGVAPTHVLLQEGRKVVKVNLIVVQSSLQSNKQRKRKKNVNRTPFVSSQSYLAEITCNDNTTYFVYSCLSGHLLELNENLTDKPHLVSEKPESEGYIAILVPRDFGTMYLTLQQYLQTRNFTSLDQKKDDNNNNKSRESSSRYFSIDSKESHGGPK